MVTHALNHITKEADRSEFKVGQPTLQSARTARVTQTNPMRERERGRRKIYLLTVGQH